LGQAGARVFQRLEAALELGESLRHPLYELSGLLELLHQLLAFGGDPTQLVF
jgi:hypothetical protein